MEPGQGLLLAAHAKLTGQVVTQDTQSYCDFTGVELVITETGETPCSLSFQIWDNMVLWGQ